MRPFVSSRGLIRRSATALTALGFVREPERRASRQLFDTFDARLHGARRVLTAEREDGQWLVALRRARSGDVVAAQLCRDLPRFWWQLPPGPVRDRLETIAGPRALLASVEVEVHERPWAQLDPAGKIIARASVDTATVDGRRRLSFLRLIPVKGYRQAAREAGRALAAGGFERTGERVYDTIQRAAGVAPDQPRWILPDDIDPAAASAPATRRVLRHLWQLVEINRQGVVAELAQRAPEGGGELAIDTEFLHDLRVAARRTRSVLAGARSVLADGAVGGFAAEFRWLGGITRAPRDLDVALLELPRYGKLLAPARRLALAPLAEQIAHRRDREYQLLAGELASDRYRALVSGWAAFLDADPVAEAPRSAEPIAAVAGELVGRAYARALRRSRDLTDRAPASQLHELRKAVKKLRYLIESFAPVYPRRALERTIGPLRRLQTALGEVQDLTVHAATLARIAAEPDGGVPADTQQAALALADELARQSAARRPQVAAALARWRDRGTLDAARALWPVMA